VAPVQAPLRDPEVVGYDCSNSASSTLLFIIGLPGLALSWARTLLRVLFRHLKLGPDVLQRDFGLPKLQSCSSLSEEK
jgi:hypothetical protein